MVLPSGTVFNLGDSAWVLTSTALVWIMIPGVGFFYCAWSKAHARVPTEG
jgi:ammonia channel protein AmtB